MSQDVKKIVAQMRAFQGELTSCVTSIRFIRDTADLIEQQAKRIAELEAGLHEVIERDAIGDGTAHIAHSLLHPEVKP